jgi:hypothetical protein
MIIFHMVEILFGLFVRNSNGELKKIITISSLPQNNRIITIFTVSKQHIYV